jgi:hypothetical protein
LFIAQGELQRPADREIMVLQHSEIVARHVEHELVNAQQERQAGAARDHVRIEIGRGIGDVREL